MNVRASSNRSQTLSRVNAAAAGIDIGSRFHVVCVPRELDAEPVRTFRSFTGDLHQLADWLVTAGIKTAAMESTGVYWIPLLEILEERGIEVLLVNARDSKNVPGRKTDVCDAQWLQQLHEHGLLRGSFRPKQEVVILRSYLRQRERMVEYSASHVQHMQKALDQMNVQVHHVVSMITGATGMRIIRDIVDGNHDPEALAKHRDARCKASPETLVAALNGNYREEHVFALGQALELYDFYRKKLEECDAKIESTLKALAESTPEPDRPIPDPKHRTRQRNEMKFDVRTALFSLLGVDLTQIHGIGPTVALKLVAECGTDTSRWPTSKHFTSWLALAPGRKISGGKVLSSRTRPSGNRAAAMLRLAAVTVGKTQTALGAFYRRVAARAGKGKAVTATARKIAVLFYNTLRYGMEYVDPGVDEYENRYRQKVLVNLRRRARTLGLQLVESEEALAGVS